MKRFYILAALAAAVAVPLSAQTWQTIGVPSNSNTGAYWNNASADNSGSAVCNVGAILTNTPGLTAGSCLNQAPTYLPLSPARLTAGNLPGSGFFLGGRSATGLENGSNPGGFAFDCGTVGCRVNLLGRIAGESSNPWGIVTSGGVVYNEAQLSGGQIVTGIFATWIAQALPGAPDPRFGRRFVSGDSENQQHAVFSATQGSISIAGIFGAIIAVSQGTYYVGMEDNTNGGRGFGAEGSGFSDRDFNDVIISIQAVPEPATVGLMGFGLLALAGIAKRRHI